MAAIGSLLPAATAAATPGTTPPASGKSSTNNSMASDALANEQTFLQLLVSQLKNQDPTNPMDGTQFVTQLAQFSQLEQQLAMRQDLDKLASSITASGSSGTGGASAATDPANPNPNPNATTPPVH